MSPLFEDKDLALELKDGQDLWINVDVEKLEIILRNIVSNALKFTEKGKVSILYGEEKGKVFIEVRDTGKGIAEENIPLLFNRFYRAEKTDGQGLGLGLAIAKELVTVMHGEIEVKSEIGEGSSFLIYLPVS
jgi:signal transduction histidine kinase